MAFFVAHMQPLKHQLGRGMCWLRVNDRGSCPLQASSDCSEAHGPCGHVALTLAASIDVATGMGCGVLHALAAKQVPVTFTLPAAEKQRITAAISRAPANISTAVATGTPPQDLVLNATVSNIGIHNITATNLGAEGELPTARSICPADSPLRAAGPSRTTCRCV